MYSMRKRPYGVIIGRFQPYHMGHKSMLEDALKDYEKVVLVLGSAQSAPSIKNPFTPQSREQMIRACLTEAQNKSLSFVGVRDYPYTLNIWLTEVRVKVLRELKTIDNKIDIIGHYKDKSSFYLKLFPSWQFNEITIRHGGISATKIRELILAKETKGLKENLPKPVLDFVTIFMETQVCKDLQDEYQFIQEYKKKTQFVGCDFQPMFVTTDCVVVQSGHVLVIRRRMNPGKGKLALPGGFLQQSETLEEGAIRELKEETKIKINKNILRANIKDKNTFDNPGRSLRGRTITTAFFIPLEENLKHGLPFVEGADDANEAFWLPLADVGRLEDEFFEDHSHIIRHFTRTT